MVLRVDGGFCFADKTTGELRYCYHCSTSVNNSAKRFGRNHVDVWCQEEQDVKIDHAYNCVMNERVDARGVSLVPAGFADEVPDFV